MSFFAADQIILRPIISINDSLFQPPLPLHILTGKAVKTAFNDQFTKAQMLCRLSYSPPL